MSDQVIEHAAWQASDDLAALADAYRSLFEVRLPSAARMDGGRRSQPEGSPAPVAVHVLDVISEVEQLAQHADQQVSAWMNRAYTAYGLWWGGEPNPLVVLSLASASHDCPSAISFAGVQMLELASAVERVVRKVKGVLGTGGAELVDDLCPWCQEPALVRLVSPPRTACAMPACSFVQYAAKR